MPSTEWFTPVTGFASGVFVTGAGAVATAIVQRHHEERKRKEAARFEVYMKLLEVNSLYFWVASAEIRGGRLPAGVAGRLRDLSWRIADKLREVDQVEYLDEILNVLLCNSFRTARSRLDALQMLIGKLGRMANPRYAAAIAAVSSTNMRAIEHDPGTRSNAPASLDDSGPPAA